MNLLFDTNIVVHLAKDYSLKLLQQINPDADKVFISVATVGELKSLAFQNNWGPRKLGLVDVLLDEMLVVEINENLIDTYAQIDAYSQCKNLSFDNIHIRQQEIWARTIFGSLQRQPSLD